MKKAIFTLGLFSMMMVLTSFTTDVETDNNTNRKSVVTTINYDDYRKPGQATLPGGGKKSDYISVSGDEFLTHVSVETGTVPGRHKKLD